MSSYTRVVLLTASTLITIPACGSMSGVRPLETVEFVDVERYMGLWYEIASFETFFNRRCTNTTAAYTLQDDGTVQVVNECRIDDASGRLNRIEGTASVVNTETNAELEVRFFFFGRGDYWIIALDENYEWAVVGDPAYQTLFILSRTPTLDDAVYDEILAQASAKCYNTDLLTLTLQQP